MKNMKQSQAEQEATAPTVLEKREDYPYCLRFTVDEGSLQKIAFAALPGVGDTMIVTARVRVTDVGDHEAEDGRNRDVGLQITDMEFGSDEEDEEDKTKEAAHQ